MNNNLLQSMLQKSHRLERYCRLFRTYVLKRNPVKRIWSHPGYLNKHRLAKPEDLLRGYFLDFSKDADYMGPFDGQGIPLLDYGGLIGLQYNPWAVSHYALASFQKYLQIRDEKYYKQFLRCASWLVDQGEYHQNGSIVWVYKFSIVKPHVKPWISALAQSYAISVLLRAFLVTDNSKYLEIADKAFISFTLPINKGGVQSVDSEGNLFFEEDSLLIVPRILNGFIFALFGIYEFATLKNDLRAWELWNKGLETLRKYLAFYDTGFFSLYNLSTDSKLKNVASPFYHLVHVLQLQILGTLTGEKLFHEYAERWLRYAEDIQCRLKAYLHKMVFKLLKF